MVEHGGRCCRCCAARRAAPVRWRRDSTAQHCCRGVRFPNPVTRTGRCSPVYKTGVIHEAAMSGDAVAAMIRRRADQAGFTPAQTPCSGDIHCGRVSSPRPSGPARTHTPSCAKPGTAPRDAGDLRAGKRPADRERRHPHRSLARDRPRTHRHNNCRPGPCKRTGRTGRCSPTGAPPPATRRCPPPRTPCCVPH